MRGAPFTSSSVPPLRNRSEVPSSVSTVMFQVCYPVWRQSRSADMSASPPDEGLKRMWPAIG